MFRIIPMNVINLYFAVQIGVGRKGTESSNTHKPIISVKFCLFYVAPAPYHYFCHRSDRTILQYYNINPSPNPTDIATNPSYEPTYAPTMEPVYTPTNEPSNPTSEPTKHGGSVSNEVTNEGSNEGTNAGIGLSETKSANDSVIITVISAVPCWAVLY